MGELAKPFDMSLPAVSKHVSVLERAGLVERHRVGRTQRCRLVPQRLDEAIGWIEERRRLWTGRLDRLERVLSDDA